MSQNGIFYCCRMTPSIRESRKHWNKNVGKVWCVTMLKFDASVARSICMTENYLETFQPNSVGTEPWTDGGSVFGAGKNIIDQDVKSLFTLNKWHVMLQYKSFWIMIKMQ